MFLFPVTSLRLPRRSTLAWEEAADQETAKTTASTLETDITTGTSTEDLIFQLNWHLILLPEKK